MQTSSLRPPPILPILVLTALGLIASRAGSRAAPSGVAASVPVGPVAGAAGAVPPRPGAPAAGAAARDPFAGLPRTFT